MLNTSMYLITKCKVDELLVVLGKKSSPDAVIECCERKQFKKLTVCYYDKEKRNSLSGIIRETVRSQNESDIGQFVEIETDELSSYCVTYEDFAVLADCLADKKIYDTVLALKPKSIVANIGNGPIDAFTLWESGREVTDHFYFHSQKQCKDEKDNRAEVLIWDRDPENDTELSVILPVYNVAKYLKKCLESLIEWKADYVEYLFINDGSPDNSSDIIREYAKKDNRVKLFEKTNGGCASARQYGMEVAKGRYIGFVDPDDFIDPTMFQKLLARAMSGNYEIAYCGYKELYESNGETKEIEDMMWPAFCQGTSDAGLINQLMGFHRIAIWRRIYSKSMLEKNGIRFYTDLRRFDDLPFKVEALAVARSVVCVPEYLYYYRMGRPGQDVSVDDERLYIHFQIFDYIDEFLGRFKDKEKTDFLEVIKIHTHEWALTKLKSQYLEEYMKLARKDLLKNMSFMESFRVARRYTRKRYQAYLLAVYYHLPWLVRALNRRFADK